MAKTRITKAMKESMVTRIVKDVPQVDYDSVVQDYFNKRAFDELPEVLKANEFQEYLKESYVSGYHLHVRNAKFKPTQEDRDFRNQQAKLGREQYDNIQALRRGLTVALGSCKYIEILAEQFPEFVRYLPEEQTPATNLPAIPLKRTLTALGWSKSDEGK